jgi:hypothetical protein
MMHPLVLLAFAAWVVGFWVIIPLRIYRHYRAQRQDHPKTTAHPLIH